MGAFRAQVNAKAVARADWTLFRGRRITCRVRVPSQQQCPAVGRGLAEGVVEVRIRGAELAGKVVRVTNRGSAAITLAADDLAPKDTLAIAIANPTLEPGSSTSVFVVGANGETDQ